MKKILILLLIIPILGFSQNKICENISFNSFEQDSKQENTLNINIAIEDEDSFMPISYPGFLLMNDAGDTIAYTSQEFATYSLADNTVYKLKIVKEISTDFSGTIEIYSGYLGRELRNKKCTKSVRFNLTSKEDELIINDESNPSIDNAIYLEYKGNETQGAGRIKKINAKEWYEYGKESSAIINVYKETHRDGNYIYLISGEAIFQFDLSRNKIMRNGVDILEISHYSNKDIEINSSLPHDVERK